MLGTLQALCLELPNDLCTVAKLETQMRIIQGAVQLGSHDTMQVLDRL